MAEWQISSISVQIVFKDCSFFAKFQPGDLKYCKKVELFHSYLFYFANNCEENNLK